MEYWRLELRDWARTQGGTAGWEIKLENLIEKLLEKQRKELVKKIEDDDSIIEDGVADKSWIKTDRTIEIIREHK